MLGNISKLVLVVCLAVSVTGSALMRNKRQSWDQSDDDGTSPSNCEAITLPYGGIKLYPIGSDHHHPDDDSCYIDPGLDCEYRFYCDDGYVPVGTLHMSCVHNVSSGEYRWTGDFPTCERIETNPIGHCENITLPHGGIKLFLLGSDYHHPDDDFCYTIFTDPDDWFLCEYRFYCDDGYDYIGPSHIKCVTNVATGESEWTGIFPTCESIHDLDNGNCKDTTVLHGGIKLFPNNSDTTHPHDDSCYIDPVARIDCEPRLYCDDGYEDSGTRDIYCGTNVATGESEYKYSGDRPTCERIHPLQPQQPDSNPPRHVADHNTNSENEADATWLKHHTYIVGPLGMLILAAIIILVVKALRRKNARPRRVIRSTITTIGIASPATASNRLSMGNGGPPAYSRFDDSHIEVPRDQSIPDIQVK